MDTPPHELAPVQRPRLPYKPQSFRSIIDDEMSLRQFDTYLDAMAAFPDEPVRSPGGEIDTALLPEPAMRVRRWGERRAKISAITPGQVVSLSRALPRFLRVAYEIEDPWRAYTIESTTYLDNDGLRKMSAFMEAIWQTDERRHAAVFKAAYLGVTGEEDVPPNPHHIEEVGLTRKAFERHVYQRLIAELSASSAYAVYASHGRDELEANMRNVAGDEFRHLAVFWAATKWRFGQWIPTRALQIARYSLELAMLHRNNRTGLSRPDVQDAIMVTEIGAAISYTMLKLLWWDRRLTRSRLESVFGPTPV